MTEIERWEHQKDGKIVHWKSGGYYYFSSSLNRQTFLLEDTSGYDKPDSLDNQRLGRVRYYRILYVYVVFIIYTLGSMMMFVIFVSNSREREGDAWRIKFKGEIEIWAF